MNPFHYRIVVKHNSHLMLEISDERSKIPTVWGISTGIWMKPTSPRSRKRLAQMGDSLIVELASTPPRDPLADRKGEPFVVLWDFDGGEDIASSPTMVTVVFPDFYVLHLSPDGYDVNYSAISVDIENVQMAPYEKRVTPREFDLMYRFTSVDDLDGVAGLRERVMDAIEKARPDVIDAIQQTDAARP